MIRKLVILPIVLLSVFLLGACGGGGSPICSPEELVAPAQTVPLNGDIYEIGSSNMAWYYPVSSCEPEGYYVEMNTASDFTGTGTDASVLPPHGMWWPPTSSFEPGTTYYWHVLASADGIDGPWSPTWWFTTKPACEASALFAPTQYWPAEGSILTSYGTAYQWGYADPACTPEGYHLQVYSNSDLTGIIADVREANAGLIWDPGIALTNCSTYYWRVAAIDGETDGPFSNLMQFHVDIDGTCLRPTCAPEDLVAPEPNAPISYSIVNTLLPDLEWENPGYCLPEGYAVHLADIFDMSDTSLFGATGTPATSWSPGVPLEPATQYFWEVAAGVDITVGPFSFPKRTFFTGPECTSSSVIAPPELVFPENGAEIELEFTWLFFDPGATGCIPDSYYIDLQTDPSFGGTSLYGASHSPVTNLLKDLNEDCTRYYWRVATVQDGIQGPFSETRWFYTNFAGNCMVSLIPDIIAEALVDLICREGPGPQYEILGYFVNGEESPIHAQDLRHEWWVVDNPDNPGELCWVLQEGMEPLGDISGVPMWNAPQAPQEEPPAPVCSINLTTEDQCEAAGGEWIVNLVTSGSSYCKCD